MLDILSGVTVPALGRYAEEVLKEPRGMGEGEIEGRPKDGVIWSRSRTYTPYTRMATDFFKNGVYPKKILDNIPISAIIFNRTTSQ
jgi:hypothetical protein